MNRTLVLQHFIVVSLLLKIENQSNPKGQSGSSIQSVHCVWTLEEIIVPFCIIKCLVKLTHCEVTSVLPLSSRVHSHDWVSWFRLGSVLGLFFCTLCVNAIEWPTRNESWPEEETSGNCAIIIIRTGWTAF